MTRHSSSSSTNKFDVFEMGEEDDRIEKTSHKLMRKFLNPSAKAPITKYQFLEVFARGSETTLKNSVPTDPINIDDEVSSESDEEEAKCLPEKVTVTNENKPVEVDEGGGTDAGAGVDYEIIYDNPGSIDTSQQRECADKEITGIDDFVISDFDLKYQQIDVVSDSDSVESDFDLKNQLIDVVSDSEDHDNDCQISSPIPTSTHLEIEVPLEDQLVEHGSTAFKIDNIKKVVQVFPAFIQCEDLYSTRSRLIFSWSSLILEGSTSNGTGGAFKIEWACEDIIKIESYWSGEVETAMINLLLKSKDSTEAGNINKKPGFKRLRFGVHDPRWSKAEEAIKLLDLRYADIWSTTFDIDADKNQSVSPLEQYSLFSQKHYFSIFDEAFDEVIYPKGEPDAVSISKRDVELLQPETFINDTIIDFYIKYLQNKIPPGEQGRFHFFNSFFFRKLADLDKDPSSACEGRAAFLRVRKWTRRVNLFEKDYIIIPINYSLHWSLIVICHPGEVVCFRDEEIEESPKVPCILHMDSLRGSHKGLKNVFQSYLCEEWKERHSNVVDDVASKFLHLRFISLELPQQENFYDCGLFLLHYVEHFLVEAPVNFNPFKITKFSNFLTSNWFPPLEASLKRSRIHNLIYNITNDNSLKAPADCLDKGHSSEEPAIIKHKVGADSQGESCYPVMCQGKNPYISTTEQATNNIQFPPTSPLKVASSSREPGLVFPALQVGLANSDSSNSLQMSACYQRGFMSPIEETEECWEETTSLSLDTENPQGAILASDFLSTSYISDDHKAPATSLGTSENFEGAVEGHSYLRSLTSVSWNTSKIGAHEDQPHKKTEWSDSADKANAIEHFSISSEEVVQDSQESNDVDVSVKSHSSVQGNMNSVSDQFFDLEQKVSVGDDTLISKKEPLTPATAKRDNKRSKQMNVSRRRLTRSMSKKSCFMSCD
ncbi:hypothetical protein RIF29_41578 [Crotalaria pallida]|uniref:Ubiquitin-like protease family profile domain-containing protein n=1 Tax=Crotalaria pallida TaxID=3830 RepID=A0AAN9HVF8_CROPI